MDPKKVKVILGPPGTGKTSYLIKLVDEALASGTLPEKIGFLSFTKKAAEQGKYRASQAFSVPPEEFQHFRTIHSFAFRHLNMSRERMVGWTHLRELGRMLGLDFKGRGNVTDDDVYGMDSADRMLFLEGLSRNKQQPLKKTWEDAMEDSIHWPELERFSRALQSYKKSRGLRDFNDLVEQFNKCDVGSLPKFDLLLIDEAQDNSSLQWDAVELLAHNAKQVYVCGDDDQTLFSWAGADVDRFMGIEGEVRVLEESHRIPRAVHSLAESVTRRISNRAPKRWSPKDKVGSVNWFSDVDQVDISKDTWLLLARNGYMLNGLEDYCLSQGFSFNSVNRDPLKSPALAALRTWESLRKGNEEPAEGVFDVLKYVEARRVPLALLSKVKKEDPNKRLKLQDLTDLGLGTTAPWFEALTKISPKERDFFRAARKRGEPLLKEPRIKISTIHSAKGGEADHTLLLTDISHRCYQNMDAKMDEELRVWYVAATRCFESLNLVMPRTDLSFEF